MELMKRHASRVTGEYLGRFKTGEMSPREAVEHGKAAAQFSENLTLIDGTTAPVQADYLFRCAEIVKGDSPHLLIIVDSLHAWVEGLMTGAPEYEALNGALLAMKRMTQRFNCPLIFVTERNKASIKEGGLSSGAGTRKIEYGAETVLDLERAEKAAPTLAGEFEVRARFAKNRHGTPGKSVDLLFNGALQSFREG
jgi:hypothetical protein